MVWSGNLAEFERKCERVMGHLNGLLEGKLGLREAIECEEGVPQAEVEVRPRLDVAGRLLEALHRLAMHLPAWK